MDFYWKKRKTGDMINTCDQHMLGIQNLKSKAYFLFKKKQMNNSSQEVNTFIRLNFHVTLFFKKQHI